jgi:hypothetical protein
MQPLSFISQTEAQAMQQLAAKNKLNKLSIICMFKAI